MQVECRPKVWIKSHILCIYVAPKVQVVYILLLAHACMVPKMYEALTLDVVHNCIHNPKSAPTQKMPLEQRKKTKVSPLFCPNLIAHHSERNEHSTAPANMAAVVKYSLTLLTHFGPKALS